MTGHVYVMLCIFRMELVDDYARGIFPIQQCSASRTFRELVIRTTNESIVLGFNAQKTCELLSRDDWCSHSTSQINCCYRDYSYACRASRAKYLFLSNYDRDAS